MEISQQFLIDMALNVGGYVLAGALGILLFSMFKKRSTVAVPVKSKPGPDKAASADDAEVVVEEKRRVEFVRLGRQDAGPTPAVKTADTTGTTSASDRRDRTETIRIARTMLKAGATADKIKRVIPISDAELSRKTTETHGEKCVIMRCDLISDRSNRFGILCENRFQKGRISYQPTSLRRRGWERFLWITETTLNPPLMRGEENNTTFLGTALGPPFTEGWCCRANDFSFSFTAVGGE